MSETEMHHEPDESLREAAAPEVPPQTPPAADEAPSATPHSGGGPRRVEVGFVAGDLTISGGAEQVVVLMPGGHGEDGAVEDREGVLRFSGLPHRTELRVPDGSEVSVREVEGDLRIARLEGSVEVGRVEGDTTLDQFGRVSVAWAGGDLEATDGEALHARSIAGDVRLERLTSDPLLGSVRGDLEVRQVPGLRVAEAIGGDAHLERTGATTLAAVGGDLEVERCEGLLRVGPVGGDVSASESDGLLLGTIGGDLSAKRLTGAVEAGTIGGDATLRAVNGHVRLGTIGGDLLAERLPAGLIVGQVGGDVTLETALGAHTEYSVQAAGDIELRVRGELHARFVAQTFGGEIRTRLPLTVERGRRRNLVGMLGRGDATVTLRSTGGDILIVAAESSERESTMSDEYRGTDGREGPDAQARSFEGNVGKHKFRLRWDKGPGKAGIYFQGPYTEEPTGPVRDFGLEWERGHGARAYGEYEQRLNELREKAEQMARRAADQTQQYAEKAAKRARETDWEAVGREVRTSVERAMSDLEEAFAQVRREWEARRPAGEPGTPSRPSAQRVRIEQDEASEPATASAPNASASPLSADERDARRRTVLEQLRTGAISLDEAERSLNDLR